MSGFFQTSTAMWKSLPKATIAVGHDTKAFFHSPHLLKPFPPPLDRAVIDVLSEEQKDGARHVMLDLTNRMATSMCPDLLSSRLLGRLVDVVSTVSSLETKLSDFIPRVNKVSALFLELFGGSVGSKPKLLVLGAVTGHTLVVRLDKLLGPGYDNSNWFTRLPACLRNLLLDPSIPLLGSGIRRKLQGVTGLSSFSCIDVEELLGFLRQHESFQWSDQRDLTSGTLSLSGFCHLAYDHYFGPIPGDVSSIRAHVARFGNPYKDDEWPCWRKEESLFSWASCLNDFQLTFLHCRVVASFVPILLYGVLSLSTGCLLANRKSSVYSVLTSCVEKLRFRGASRDLLLGRSRGFLRMFGPVDLIDPKYQYHIVTTSDFLELSTAIYVSRNTGSHVLSPGTMDQRMLLANTVANSQNGGKTTVGSHV